MSKETKYKRFDGERYRRYRHFMVKKEAVSAAEFSRRGKKYWARVTKERQGWVVWLRPKDEKHDIDKIKFKGQLWDLWTEIPPWSDYLPYYATEDAKEHYPEVATKRQSKYGTVYVQILVRGKRKTKRRQK